MNVKTFLQRSQLFVAKGPSYILSYLYWRTVRLGTRLQRQICSPAWSAIPELPNDDDVNNSPTTKVGTTLVAYLISRKYPCFHFSPPEMRTIADQIPSQYRTHTAKNGKALIDSQHTYRGITVTFDTEPNWDYAPDGSIDWRWDLNRHYWLPTLARAWHYSGDEAFARGAARLLLSWMASNPPDVRNPVWRPFEVAIRLNNWLWGLFLLLDCPAFVREGARRLWQGLIAQARYLNRHLEHHVVNNHLLVETKTLAMLGLLFPELPEADQWYNGGLDGLWKQVRRQFHPDGVHTEQATQYHALCTGELWELLNLLRRNGRPIPSDVLARFEAAVDFQTAIVKPDGHIPLFGDSVRHDLHRRFDPRWASVWLDGKVPTTTPPNEETRWLLGADPLPEKVKQPPRSCAFPDGGYTVMRDTSRYLVLDCGPFGDNTVPSHAHADALSLEICSGGQTLLTDSGGYSYHAPPLWRNYFRGTRAHNTVMVDDIDQSQLLGMREVVRPAKARLVDWISNQQVDWALTEHDGYTRLSDPVIHRRQVLFIGKTTQLGKAYWLVIDSLQGTAVHRLDWQFHLHPDANWTLEPMKNYLRATVGNAGLLIAPAPLHSLTAQVIKGQMAPPLGWVSLESGKKEPSPTFALSLKGELPRHMAFALVPHRAKHPMPVNFRVLAVDAEVLTIALNTRYVQDLVSVALGDTVTTLNLGPLMAQARVLILRKFNDDVSIAFAMRAKAMHAAEERIWHGNASWVSMAREKDSWVITDSK